MARLDLALPHSATCCVPLELVKIIVTQVEEDHLVTLVANFKGAVLHVDVELHGFQNGFHLFLQGQEDVDWTVRLVTRGYAFPAGQR